MVWYQLGQCYIDHDWSKPFNITYDRKYITFAYAGRYMKLPIKDCEIFVFETSEKSVTDFDGEEVLVNTVWLFYSKYKNYPEEDL